MNLLTALFLSAFAGYLLSNGDTAERERKSGQPEKTSAIVIALVSIPFLLVWMVFGFLMKSGPKVVIVLIILSVVTFLLAVHDAASKTLCWLGAYAASILAPALVATNSKGNKYTVTTECIIIAVVTVFAICAFKLIAKNGKGGKER